MEPYRLASWWRRALAWWIDLLIVCIPLCIWIIGVWSNMGGRYRVESWYLARMATVGVAAVRISLLWCDGSSGGCHAGQMPATHLRCQGRRLALQRSGQRRAKSGAVSGRPVLLVDGGPHCPGYQAAAATGRFIGQHGGGQQRSQGMKEVVAAVHLPR